MTWTQKLATFDDRFTMRHVREYPHPIASVFEAVTTTDEINAWLLPIAEVEPRLGGRCSFTWGGPRGSEMVGVVKEFDPPRLVHYDLLGSFLRFELEALDERTTRLTLLHRIERHGVDTLTLWPADVVLGFHTMVDTLGSVLDGTRDAEAVRLTIKACENGSILEHLAAIPDAQRAENDRLLARYGDHIVATCPPDPGPARALTPLEAGIRGKSDAEISAWADQAGGLSVVCDLVMKEMANRLQPTGDLVVGYDLGADSTWTFRTTDGSALVAREAPPSGTTVMRMSPEDFLRMVVNDLPPARGLESGAITVDGDPADVRRFYAMTERGRGSA